MADIPIDKLPDHINRLWLALDSAPLAAPLAKCADELRQGFAANFANNGSPHFGAWPPRKDRLPHPLLRLRLRLFGAATQQGAAGNVSEIGPREANVGVEKTEDLLYTHVQNYGWPQRNIPARTYIDVGDEVLDKCGQHIGDGVMEVLP